MEDSTENRRAVVNPRGIVRIYTRARQDDVPHLSPRGKSPSAFTAPPCILACARAYVESGYVTRMPMRAYERDYKRAREHAARLNGAALLKSRLATRRSIDRSIHRSLRSPESRFGETTRDDGLMCTRVLVARRHVCGAPPPAPPPS